MTFLKIAEEYTEFRNDYEWFCNIYTKYREVCSIDESVWKTLAYLYDDSIAYQLEQVAKNS